MPPTAVASSSGRIGPRRRRRLIWLGSGVAALVAVIAVFWLWPDKNAAPQHLSPLPATLPPTKVAAPITAEAKQVAIHFIRTAVARKNLDVAWTLVGPNLRGGLTKAQWTTGNNPVIPYPIDKLDVAPFKVDESFKDSALIEIILIPKKGAGVRSQDFFLELKKVGKGANAHWVVDNWVPRAGAVVPQQ
jgi:hypothetical protein